MTIGGVWGKILHVNLTDGRSWVEQLPDEVYLRLVGGRALVAYLLLRDLPAGADPLGPDNLLIFAPGILQGTNLPGAGRHGVGAKSPLTGGLASSEAGGWWGHEFKRTGYDALVVHGSSPSPVYLWIRDGEVTLMPAGHLWGRDTSEADAQIHDELADAKASIALCGVAGENHVLFASIIHDVNRAAARNGLGAVMGSKQLKALAVRGTKTLAVADRGACCRCRNGWATTTGAFGLGGFDGHAGQPGLPERHRRPAHAQLPGSILPGCRKYQRPNHAEDDPPRARHLPGLSDPLQAGRGIHGQAAEENLSRAKRQAGQPTPAVERSKRSTAAQNMRLWPPSGAIVGSATWWLWRRPTSCAAAGGSIPSAPA